MQEIISGFGKNTHEIDRLQNSFIPPVTLFANYIANYIVNNNGISFGDTTPLNGLTIFPQANLDSFITNNNLNFSATNNTDFVAGAHQGGKDELTGEKIFDESFRLQPLKDFREKSMSQIPTTYSVADLQK